MDRLLLLGLLASQLTSATATAAQRGWEVHGQLTGIVTGWHGAVIAVPVLRIGTISGGQGTFKLRSTAPGGCYEALVRTAPHHVTHIWFLAPDSGLRELGELEIPAVPREWDPPPNTPAVHDTIRGCQPEKFSDEITWPAVHTVLTGRLVRGSRPLADVPIDLGCGSMLSIRTSTDSDGRFRFYYPVSFPEDQSLGEGGLAACRLWIATVTLDEPRDLTLRFGPHDKRAPEQQVHWALPAPDFRPRRLIGRPGGREAPLRVPGTASFSPGVLDAPSTLGLQLLNRPGNAKLYEAGACSTQGQSRASRAWNWQKCGYAAGRRLELPSGDLLPVALRVTTGRQVATTGSDFILAVPAAYAARAAAGERFEAFARLPARYNGPPDAFIRIGVSYSPSLQLLTWTLTDFHFDDERTADHVYEAVIVLALRQP